MYVTIRDLINGKAILAASPLRSKNPSPLAQHISEHMQDPLGSTKEGFEDLQNKRMQYDQSRESMQRQLGPVQKVIDHVSMLHGLDPNLTMGNQSDPNNPDMDEFGNPMNMGQTPGQMNQNRPSQAGFKPGVAPGFNEKQVVPQKMGMASPGGPGARNSPQPGNGAGDQYNKLAKKPKGNRSLPGAKGPGDPKMRAKSKAAEKGAKGVTVNVKAAGVGVLGGSNHNRVRTLAQLHCSTVSHSADSRIRDNKQVVTIDRLKAAMNVTMPHGGSGGGAISKPSGMAMPGGGGGTIARSGRTAMTRMEAEKKKNKMKGLASGLSDKDMGDNTAESYNAKFQACAKCGGMHAEGGNCKGKMEARDFSQARRKQDAKSGKAMKHGGYPIENLADLRNAKRAFGRAKNPAATRRHINQRAKALHAKPLGQAV